MNVVAMTVNHALRGLYSDMELAKVAAKCYMKTAGGTWVVDKREHEIQYHQNKDGLYAGQGHDIILDYWEVDKALLDGQWVNLKRVNGYANGDAWTADEWGNVYVEKMPP